MALAVLEEVAARAAYAPQTRTRGLALALAFLAGEARSKDRQPFDDFWRLLSLDDLNGRRVMLGCRLAEIYAALGRERCEEVRQAFVDLARAELGTAPGIPFG